MFNISHKYFYNIYFSTFHTKQIQESHNFKKFFNLLICFNYINFNIYIYN